MTFEHRVKEILRSKNLTIKTLAERMGRKPESLSKTLKGNPELKTIKKIAEVLKEPVRSLFEDSFEPNVKGYVEYGGEIRRITCVQDLKDIVEEIEKDETADML